MIEILITAAIAGVIGMGLGGAIEQHNQRKTNQADDGHEHFWEPWSTPKLDPIYEGDDRVGTIVTQSRACLHCALIDYRRDTHLNQEKP